MSSLSVTGLTFGIGFTFWALYRIRTRAREFAQLPGPPNPSVLSGNLDDVRAAPAGTRFNVWQAKYGATYCIRGALLEPILVLGDPRGVSHMLANVPDYPRPEIANIVLQQWFGNSVFSAEGDKHRAMRKMLNPAYTFNAAKESASVLMDLAEDLAALWAEHIGASDSSNIEVDVMNVINGFTLDAISLTSFAYKITAPSRGERSLQGLLETFSGNGPFMGGGGALLGVLIGTFPSLLRLPNPLSKAAATLRSELGRIARDVWGTDKAARRGQARILEMMDKGQGHGMSEEEAIAQIVGLLFAGSETVANLLSETLYELALQPDLQSRVRAELEDAREAAGGTLSFDELMSAERLPLFDALCRESLRTKSPLADIARCAARDGVIPLAFALPDGSTSLHVRKGTFILVPLRDGVATNPDIWGADADVFRPERWLEHAADDRRELIRAQGNVLTFGDGARVCLGRQFAVAEYKVLISTLVSAFELAPASGVKLDFYHLAGNTIKPKIRGRESEGVKLPIHIRRVNGTK